MNSIFSVKYAYIRSALASPCIRSEYKPFFTIIYVKSLFLQPMLACLQTNMHIIECQSDDPI